MRNPKVINAIRELQDQYLVGEAKSVALTTLVDVMRNSKSDQAKVGACRVVESFLRAKDEKDGDDKPGKPIEEMSVGELESYMSTLSAAIEKRMSEQQIVDGEAHVID